MAQPGTIVRVMSKFERKWIGKIVGLLLLGGCAVLFMDVVNSLENNRIDLYRINEFVAYFIGTKALTNYPLILKLLEFPMFIFYFILAFIIIFFEVISGKGSSKKPTQAYHVKIDD